MLDESPCQQTRLPEARAAIAIREFGRFARYIEHPHRIRRGQKCKGLGAVVVDGALVARVEGTADLIERLQQLVAIA